MDIDREMDKVLLNVHNSAGVVVAATLFSSALSLKLLIFLMRMAKKGLIASGIPDKFKNFMQKTAGEYIVYNIPLSEENAEKMNQLNQMYMDLDKEKNPVKSMLLKADIKEIENAIPQLQQLKMLGIEYCTLPKINGSMQTIQVGIAKEQEQSFKNWFLNHLTTELSGGLKNVESIKVFTEGNYTILNMPFEKEEELSIMFSDFNQMGINYAKCPDLKVGDGYTQIAIPNSDRGLVEDWFKMWKNKQMAEGNDVSKEMSSLDEQSYLSTGEVTAEEYINASEPIYKEANAEFEKETVKMPWEGHLSEEINTAFEKFNKDENYVCIHINKEALVDSISKESYAVQLAEKHGIFISRIPGTYGENEELLAIPKNQVFLADDGTTYVAFLHKKKNHIVYGADQKFTRRNCEEISKFYDKTERGLQKINEILDKDFAKCTEKNISTKISMDKILKV